MEKHFCIDPGQGKKMDGCPYSIYEDGHDVKDYIIPPKGHKFIGFKYEPLHNNQIYDGKLVAQYEKSTIKQRLSSNVWKILIPVIIVAVLGLVAVLAVSVFKEPTPPTPKMTPKLVVAEPQKDSVDQSVKDSVEQPVVEPVQESNNETQPEKTEVIQDQKEPVNQPVEEQVVETKPQAPQPVVDEPNTQFKKEFWTLIHQRTIKMDPYHELYVNNKGQVSGEEYDYLRYTILKDFANFKEWREDLKKIPENKLQSIETINELKQSLKE